MSVILAAKNKNKIIFGADKRMIFAYQAYDNEKKIHQIAKDCIYGMCGLMGLELQVHDLFTELFKIQEGRERELLTKQKLYKQLKPLINEIKWTEDEDILLGIGNQIFHVYPFKLTIYEIDEVEAIGSGANYALGAYNACHKVKKSIEIAIKYHIECGGNVDLLEYSY